jgi:hypothetical protein
VVKFSARRSTWKLQFENFVSLWNRHTLSDTKATHAADSATLGKIGFDKHAVASGGRLTSVVIFQHHNDGRRIARQPVG